MKKIKFLKGLSAPVLVAPILAVSAVSCGEKESELLKQIYNDAYDEFIDLCQVWRPTFHTKYICDYIRNRIAELAPTLQVDFDTYSSGEDDTGHNLKIDVPASQGYENLPIIIVQCHTDMVWVVNPSAEAPLPEHPEPDVVTKGNKTYIFSKDQKSSLGADNGVGIATSLSLIKNKDLYTHGPIRFLMTTDEEDGLSGAHYVPNDWVVGENIKYLINLDLEGEGRLGVGTNGVQQATWSRKFERCQYEKDVFTHGYCITLSGLLGGHSAVALRQDPDRSNAIKVGVELLKYIAEIDGGNPIQLFWLSEKYDDNNEATSGTIPNYLKIGFAAEEDKTTRIYSICKRFEEAWNHDTKHIEQGDNNLKIELENSFTWDVKSKGMPLTVNGSLDLIDFLSHLPYGVFKTRSSDGVPTLINNVGCLRLNDRKYTKQTKYQDKVYLEMFGRALDIDDLGPQEQDPTAPTGGFLKQYFDTSSSFAFREYDDDKGAWENLAWNPPWEEKEGSQIHDILSSVAREQGISNLYDYFEAGWLEVAEFAKKNSERSIPGNLEISALGCELYNPHTWEEGVEFTSLKPMMKILLGMFEWITKGGEK